MLRNKWGVLLVCLLGLVGCQPEGYTITPLYKNNVVNKKLQAVYVATIPGKYGVYLHNKLVYLVNPIGTPVYRLNVSFVTTERKLSITHDDSSARQEIRLDAKFTIQFIDGSNRKDETFSVVSFGKYTSVSTPYKTEVAKDKALKNALSLAARMGVLQLAIMLNNK